MCNSSWKLHHKLEKKGKRAKWKRQPSVVQPECSTQRSRTLSPHCSRCMWSNHGARGNPRPWPTHTHANTPLRRNEPFGVVTIPVLFSGRDGNLTLNGEKQKETEQLLLRRGNSLHAHSGLSTPLTKTDLLYKNAKNFDFDFKNGVHIAHLHKSQIKIVIVVDPDF